MKHIYYTHVTPTYQNILYKIPLGNASTRIIWISSIFSSELEFHIFFTFG